MVCEKVVFHRVCVLISGFCRMSPTLPVETICVHAEEKTILSGNRSAQMCCKSPVCIGINTDSSCCWLNFEGGTAALFH